MQTSSSDFEFDNFEATFGDSPSFSSQCGSGSTFLNFDLEDDMTWLSSDQVPENDFESLEEKKMTGIREDLQIRLQQQLPSGTWTGNQKNEDMSRNPFRQHEKRKHDGFALDQNSSSPNSFYGSSLPVQVPPAPPPPPPLAHLTSNPFSHLAPYPSPFMAPYMYPTFPSQSPIPLSPFLSNSHTQHMVGLTFQPPNVFPRESTSLPPFYPPPPAVAGSDPMKERTIAPKPPILPPPNFHQIPVSSDPSSFPKFDPLSPPSKRSRVRSKRKSLIRTDLAQRQKYRIAKDKFLSSRELHEQLASLRAKFEASEAESKMLKERLSCTESQLAELRMKFYDSSPSSSPNAPSSSPFDSGVSPSNYMLISPMTTNDS
jgi:hypothetical protein